MSVHRNHRVFPKPIALAGQPRARGWYIASALLLLIALAALFGAALVAQAATITGTGTGDVVADDGTCTLREAIIAANSDTPSGDTPGECPAGSGPDTIILAAWAAYTLTMGELSVTSGITIMGNEAIIQRSSAEGTPEFRVFHVAGNGDLALEGLNISDGRSDAGGGIRNDGGTVTLAGSTVEGNVATGELGQGGGGGIYNNGGTVTLAESAVSGNISAFKGGGIYDERGTVSLTNSTVSGNISAVQGGGIWSSLSVVTLAGSTVRDNIATNERAPAAGEGGGIFHEAGTITLENSTVSGNSAVRQGSGISSYFSRVALISSTVTGNTVYPDFDSGISTSVAGIFSSSGASTTLRNTIVARNHGEDCAASGTGEYDSLGYNIDSDGTCNLDHPTDIPATNPGLGLLQDNGGPTWTHALIPGSPAIDAIPPASCLDLSGNPLTTDQRGVSRPQGDGCDIGAVEAGDLPPLFPFGDLNCDGAVNIFDVIALLRWIVGLVSKLEPCVV